MNRRRTRPNAGGEAARAALIAAGERLFAEQGIEGVSLREIGAAAGKRDSNVTQYHFGDRDGLVREIVLARTAPVNAHRMALLDAVGGEPAGLARALVEPLAVYLDGDSYFLEFLLQLMVHREGRLPFARDVTDETTSAFVELVRRLGAALPQLGSAVAFARTELSLDFAVMALASRARSERRGAKRLLPRTAFVAEVVRAADGILGTPCR